MKGKKEERRSGKFLAFSFAPGAKIRMKQEEPSAKKMAKGKLYVKYLPLVKIAVFRSRIRRIVSFLSSRIRQQANKFRINFDFYSVLTAKITFSLRNLMLMSYSK